MSATQDSKAMQFRQWREEYEARCLEFARLLREAFEESGLKWREAQKRGIDMASLSKSTRFESRDFRMPQVSTLMQWCDVLYAARGYRLEDWNRCMQLLQLAGYAPPREVNETLRETTKHRAVHSPVQQPKETSTEPLGNLGDKSYVERLESATKASPGTKQFKALHG